VSRCVDERELMRLLAGELSAEGTERVQQHCDACAGCAALRSELLATTTRLRNDVDEFRDDAAVDEVMQLIRTGKADRQPVAEARTSPWKFWQTWLLIPATAAATAVLMLVFAPARDHPLADGVQARGSSGEKLDRWVSLQIFRAVEGGYEPVQDVLAADDALAFTYLNRSGNHLHYLAVFALDARGKVFWYYPPQPGDSASSIAIQASAEPVELPEQVVHDLTPGLLRVFGIFSARALSSQQLERQLRSDLSHVKDLAQLSRLSLSDVGQHSLLLRVEPARSKDSGR
jgi:hypothetical protein